MTRAITSNHIQATQNIAQNEAVLGGYAYQIIRQQSKRIFKLRSLVLADTDPENLHQMRISTRRLNAALTLFSDVVIREPDAQKQKQSNAITVEFKSIKKLTKSLGKVRDLDIMQQWIEQVLSPKSSGTQNAKSEATVIDLSKKEKKAIKALLKTVAKRRKKQFSKLKKALKSNRYQKLTRHFKQWTKQPVFSSTAEQSAKADAIQRIVGPITQLLRHPGWLLASQAKGSQQVPIKNITLEQLNQQLETDEEQLHELRKQIKQVRYQIEFFRGLYDITYAAQVREFRTLQKILGQIQDQLVVSEFLEGEMGKNWQTKLPSINAAFQSSRVDLWKQWQPYQQKYLKLRNTLPKKEIAV